MRITVGGRGENVMPIEAPPISAASSSWTILTTCWPGLSWPTTSAPRQRSFTVAVNCLTTLKLTSASSSARRISRIALLMSSSVSVPWARTSASVSWSFSDRASNTGSPVYGAARASPRDFGACDASHRKCGLPHRNSAACYLEMARAAWEAWRRRPIAPPRRSAMRTYTATTTAPVRPEALLDVLTDPEAIAVWAPVPFSVDDQSHSRLAEGSRVRVSGRLAGQEIGFDVEVHPADAGGPALSAHGPVALDVAYELRASGTGSEVSASVAVLPRRGLRARLLAEATAAMLASGALQLALGRIAAEAVAA